MVKIVTDSPSDIPNSIAHQLDIQFLATRILFTNNVYLDGINLSKNDFYKKLVNYPFHPLTTPPSPYQIYKDLKEIEQYGEDILIILISPSISQFAESVKLAIPYIKNVQCRIFNSTGTSMYQGLIVIQAAKMVNAGLGIDEIIEKLQIVRERTILYAIANTFEFLIKGGRVPIAKGKLGALLGINPLLEINNDKIEAIGKPKGLDEGIIEIMELLKNKFSKDEPLIGSIVHSENQVMASKLSTEVSRYFNITEMIKARIGPAIGANIGPGAIGVALSPVAEY